MLCKIVGTPDSVTTDDVPEAFPQNIVCLNPDSIEKIDRNLELEVKSGDVFFSLNAGNILAMDSESPQDTAYLMELNADIAARKSIVFVSKDFNYQYPTSPTIGDSVYFYPIEISCFKSPEAFLNYLKPSEYSKRTIFSRFAKKMALEEGLIVYELRKDNKLYRIYKNGKSKLELNNCTNKDILNLVMREGGL